MKREFTALLEFISWTKTLFLCLIALSSFFDCQWKIYSFIFTSINIISVISPISSMFHGGMTIIIALIIEFVLFCGNLIYLIFLISNQILLNYVTDELLLFMCVLIFVFIVAFLQAVSVYILYKIKDTSFVERFPKLVSTKQN